jgi:hypothetical protein
VPECLKNQLSFNLSNRAADQIEVNGWAPMLEELLPTEELEIGILDPAVTQRLIAQVVREQWATRQLRIRAHGATGWVAGAASY